MSQTPAISRHSFIGACVVLFDLSEYPLADIPAILPSTRLHFAEVVQSPVTFAEPSNHQGASHPLPIYQRLVSSPNQHSPPSLLTTSPINAGFCISALRFVVRQKAAPPKTTVSKLIPRPHWLSHACCGAIHETIASILSNYRYVSLRTRVT